MTARMRPTSPAAPPLAVVRVSLPTRLELLAHRAPASAPAPDGPPHPPQ